VLIALPAALVLAARAAEGGGEQPLRAAPERRPPRLARLLAQLRAVNPRRRRRASHGPA
jgi:hypothetical protein